MAWIVPSIAAIVAGVGAGLHPSLDSSLGIAFSALLVPVLFAAVFAAVHHAEVIAHRTGEPLGTLLLTLSVTIIEVALIVSIMLAHGAPDAAGHGGSPALARDTVFSVVMIVCNGLVGLCIVLGGLRYREQEFSITGAGVFLSVLFALCTLTLVLPNYTQAAPGPTYSDVQLEFVAAVTVALYAGFLFIQTVAHREYFVARPRRPLPATVARRAPPSGRAVTLSALLLLASLASVVLLAERFAAVVEVGVARIGAPPAVAGVLVAMLILLPESVAAVRAALHDALQNSINLALGSSLASIGLTIPAVAAVALVLDRPLVLGLGAKDTVLFVLTAATSLLTFATGRTNVLHGFVHLVIFATFLFLAFVP